MNFELSLPLIWLLVFDVFSFGFLIKEKKLKNILKYWQWLLFPAFLTISVFWSPNFTRGVLTVGILWLLYFASFSVFIFRDLFKEEKFKRCFWKWFFSSAVLICVWCFVQCILDLAGVSREYSLMCAGCTYKSFGFPHPNGFAIEPQFMGNLLLAPAIMSAWFFIKDEGNSTSRGRVASARRHGRRALMCSVVTSAMPLKVLLPFIFISTLFLTFSRGAIYAFIVAMIFMTVLVWSSKSLASGHASLRSSVPRGFRGRSPKLTVPSQVFRAPLRIWAIIIVAFLFTLNMQGIMAEVSPTNDTYFTGVSKVLNHLSLGIIDLRGNSSSGLDEFSEDISEKDQALESEVYLVENIVENSEKIGESASFDGYVAESTEIRKMLTRSALKAWRKDFKTMMFGVGIGGAGRAMFDEGLIDLPKEIVQNQYASLLLETGIFGVLLLILTLVLIFRALLKSAAVVPILTLFVAYGITLVFFAGLPNALHIYLLPPILMVLLAQNNSLRKKLVSS